MFEYVERKQSFVIALGNFVSNEVVRENQVQGLQNPLALNLLDRFKLANEAYKKLEGQYLTEVPNDKRKIVKDMAVFIDEKISKAYIKWAEMYNRDNEEGRKTYPVSYGEKYGLTHHFVENKKQYEKKADGMKTRMDKMQKMYDKFVKDLKLREKEKNTIFSILNLLDFKKEITENEIKGFVQTSQAEETTVMMFLENITAKKEWENLKVNKLEEKTFQKKEEETEYDQLVRFLRENDMFISKDQFKAVLATMKALNRTRMRKQTIVKEKAEMYQVTQKSIDDVIKKMGLTSSADKENRKAYAMLNGNRYSNVLEKRLERE